jgi:hypothetical protein
MACSWVNFLLKLTIKAASCKNVDVLCCIAMRCAVLFVVSCLCVLRCVVLCCKHLICDLVGESRSCLFGQSLIQPARYLVTDEGKKCTVVSLTVWPI